MIGGLKFVAIKLLLPYFVSSNNRGDCSNQGICGQNHFILKGDSCDAIAQTLVQVGVV